MTDMRQMSANLMQPSGLWLGADQRESAVGGQALEFGDGLLAFADFLPHSNLAAFRAERRVHAFLLPRHGAENGRQVFLADRAAHELLVQRARAVRIQR